MDPAACLFVADSFTSVGTASWMASCLGYVVSTLGRMIPPKSHQRVMLRQTEHETETRRSHQPPPCILRHAEPPRVLCCYRSACARRHRRATTRVKSWLHICNTSTRYPTRCSRQRISGRREIINLSKSPFTPPPPPPNLAQHSYHFPPPPFSALIPLPLGSTATPRLPEPSSALAQNHCRRLSSPITHYPSPTDARTVSNTPPAIPVPHALRPLAPLPTFPRAAIVHFTLVTKIQCPVSQQGF
ncbi:hypothetical protein M427DRAFT_233876 [Gonapodya prolifera JEL478]|uniref:Uncharacterized protein n=1 Tax=Gonapodya prolifera (strain JEL478) TaxID=1344416 RepID=A0A139AM71_GONPJ|nr:hypothetical protein M427DRAFT_233876 [Gonapodya prolifera JEL478]|eukprot:KXS17849.1 hypothetical protein M427DRAFT_233876 [Gonapodya prolifera JEL478]